MADPTTPAGEREEEQITQDRRLGQSIQRFGPKSSDHPSIGRVPICCGVPFRAGDFTTLIATQPANEEERQKMEAGRAYTARAEEVHWSCARRLPSGSFDDWWEELRAIAAADPEGDCAGDDESSFYEMYREGLTPAEAYDTVWTDARR